MQRLLTLATDVTDIHGNETTTAVIAGPISPQGVLWVPYLAVVFFVLTTGVLVFSVYRYWSRVRKRQQTMLDYLEVDIDLKRRRICGMMRTPIRIRFNEIHCESIPHESSTRPAADAHKRANDDDDYFLNQPSRRPPSEFTHSKKSTSNRKRPDSHSRGFELWNVESASEQCMAPSFRSDCQIVDSPPFNNPATSTRIARCDDRVLPEVGFHSEPGLFTLTSDLLIRHDPPSTRPEMSKIRTPRSLDELQSLQIDSRIAPEIDKAGRRLEDTIRCFDSTAATSEPLLDSSSSRDSPRKWCVKKHVNSLKLRSERRKFFAGLQPNEAAESIAHQGHAGDCRSSEVGARRNTDLRKNGERTSGDANAMKCGSQEKIISRHCARGGHVFKNSVGERSPSFAISDLATSRVGRDSGVTKRCLDIETVRDGSHVFSVTHNRRKMRPPGSQPEETELFLYGAAGGGGSNPGSDTTDSSLAQEYTGF